MNSKNLQWNEWNRREKTEPCTKRIFDPTNWHRLYNGSELLFTTYLLFLAWISWIHLFHLFCRIAYGFGSSICWVRDTIFRRIFFFVFFTKFCGGNEFWHRFEVLAIVFALRLHNFGSFNTTVGIALPIEIMLTQRTNLISSIIVRVWRAAVIFDGTSSI